ncbi:replication initiation protein [Senegalia sp. (in: firmicutes)]|uniref:replication initiation protein n=1 Tax=Senegalia sp. (in: firmicutes) TaxID=1924098 RepID=UPI003F9DCDF7
MNGENWVVKSNIFIESKAKMTSLEQKIILALASEISIDDEDFKDYEFSIKEFIELTGSDETVVYKRIHDSARRLMQKIITFERDNAIITTALLSSAKTIKGEGKIIFRFDKELKPELLQLKELFTQYQLKNVLKLSGSHSIRIYELLKQYEKIRKREFEVNKIKTLLGLSEEYSRFYDFERYVLKPAKEEINEKTDIWIDYKKIKEGRRIGKIIFEIYSKHAETEETKMIEALYSDEEIEDIKTKSGLRNTTFNKKQIMELYEIAVEKTEDKDIEVYRYISDNYIYTLQKAPKNKFSYFKKALKEDYSNSLIQLHM